MIPKRLISSRSLTSASARMGSRPPPHRTARVDACLASGRRGTHRTTSHRPISDYATVGRYPMLSEALLCVEVRLAEVRTNAIRCNILLLRIPLYGAQLPRRSGVKRRSNLAHKNSGRAKPA